MAARNHRSTLAVFVRTLDECVPGQITARHIDHWMESRRHLSPATRRACFSQVRCFCRWLVRRGYLASDPTIDVPAPKVPRSVPRALQEDAVAALLDVCPDTRALAIVWCMVGLGMRCVEVSRLQVADWDRQRSVITACGKGSHERVLPVPPEVASALSDYLTDYPARSGPLIRSYKRPAQGLLADTLSGMVSEWMRAALIKRIPRDGVSAHALRATAASDVLDTCGDLRVVQEMLGHQSLAPTSIYLRRAGLGQMRTAMEGRHYKGTEPGGSAA